MWDFLWLYTNVVAGDGLSPANPVGGHWTHAADQAACKKISHIYDESLAANLKLHLQSIGKFVCAQDLVEYLSIPEHQACHSFTKTISQRTAQRWMNHLGFHWRKEPNGRHCDGHKWEDVTQMTKWKSEGEITIKDVEANAALSGCQIIVWFHDEWVHSSEGAVPQPKGEGAFLMAANFVSPLQIVRRVLEYFTNDDILAHAIKAMDVLEKWYSHEDYVLMPKGPSATWGVPRTIKDAYGNIVLGPDGKPLKEKIPMAEARLLNGNPQSLYFPNGHPKARFFKGMAQILVERGYVDASKLCAECKDFKCLTDSGGVCCCRQLMYIQPDFVNVNFDVIFLLKFHCELNFIEQCWGITKQLYQMKDRSSSEEVLERNVIESLDAVPMESMRCFAMRSTRFIDGYQKGLNGMQAAWAIKKYCHFTVYDKIKDLFEAHGHPYGFSMFIVLFL
ncbi:hypothetical protein C8R48DRAFT_749228 [Suillus tomentosus]|nr:hypothetical protein C8R48DRAFT_749228 [Suillus tomentosus]